MIKKTSFCKMETGIITCHCVCNFWAQLQAISTVGFLRHNGYEPVVIHWYHSVKWYSLPPQEEAKGLNQADVILSIQEDESIFYRYLKEEYVQTNEY